MLDNDHVKMMTAGGLAGSLAKTLTAPLSRLTILYQVNHLAKPGGHFKSYSMNQPLWNVVKDITRQEGAMSFWRGNLTAVIHRFPYSAVNFAVYDFVKKQLKSGMSYRMKFLSFHLTIRLFTSNMLDSTSNDAEPFVRFASGAISGSMACTFCYPLDLVRTRLSLAGDYNGIADTIYRVATEEGFLGLYCGLSAALAVAVPQIAINYSVYGSIKSSIKHKKHPLLYNTEEEHISALGCVVSGALSGVLASLLTFPADVLRRRMQLRGATVDGDVRISLITEMQKIYKYLLHIIYSIFAGWCAYLSASMDGYAGRAACEDFTAD